MKVEPFRECPRFQKCSTNNCPLHPLYMYMHTDRDDPDPVCTMEKQVRERIGAKYSDILRYKGLTSREYGAKLRWEALSPEEQQERIAKAKLNLSIRSVKNEIESAGVGEGAPADFP